MRLDNADPLRDLLIIFGMIGGVLLACMLVVVVGAACEALLSYIKRKLPWSKHDA